MHNNDWLQRNKVIKPGTASSGMQAAGTKTQDIPYYQQISSQFKSTSKVGIMQKKQLHQLREANAENQPFVSTGYRTETIKNGNVVKTKFQTKKSTAPQKQTIPEKNSKQISGIATNSKVNNQQTKRPQRRMFHSLAGVNNPKNNLNKAETATKNNAKINSKDNERIKIQQKNNELILNRIIADKNNELTWNGLIASIKSKKIKHQNEQREQRVNRITAYIKSREIKENEERFYKMPSNINYPFYKRKSNIDSYLRLLINYQRLGIDAKYNEANQFNHQNRYANQNDANDANVTFG